MLAARSVFEKFESWTFLSPPSEKAVPAMWNFWSQRGYHLQSTGPSSFQGRSFQSRIGIHRVVDVTAQPAGSGVVVGLRYRADVNPEVAAGGVVVAVLLLPVAVLGGALSWHTYESDWSRERWDFWQFLTGTSEGRPAPGTSPPPPPSSPLFGQSAPSPVPSPSTGAAPPSSVPLSGPSSSKAGPRACPTCGARATGAGRFCATCGAPLASGAHP